MHSEVSYSTGMPSPEHNTTDSTQTYSSTSSSLYSLSSFGLEGSQYFYSSPSDILEPTLDLNDDSCGHDFNSGQLSESAVQYCGNFTNFTGALSPSSDRHVSFLPSSQPGLPLRDSADDLHPGAWIPGAQQLSTPDPLHLSRAASRHRESISTTSAAHLQVRCLFDSELDASRPGSHSNRSLNGIMQDTATNPTGRAMESPPAASIIDLDVQNSTPETDRPRPFTCDRTSKYFHDKPCGRAFRQRRDLWRHEQSVHSSDGCPRYRCQCGKLDIRKDNHKRHVDLCRRGYKDHYTCICGDQCVEPDDHLLHVKQCRHGSGPRRGGR
ncbi:hypothetical protein BJ166DRAFT_299326 [Pestalotiopsis sp. NC0098]|nr:hypothetical protein BJ166DRAFT_299326 [Pestalotiopsis sp. NC0098]